MISVDNIIYLSGILSLLSIFIIILSIKNDTSVYSQIMYKICITEGVFIYSRLVVEKVDIILQLTSKFPIIPKNLIYLSNFYLNIITCLYTILLNCALSLEMFFILRNPVAQQKNRVTKYSIIIFTFCFTEFIVLFWYFSDLKDKDNVRNTFFDTIKRILLLNLLAYVLFLIIGIISIVLLINRFCCGRFIIKNIKNNFVIRHILYTFFYLIVFFPTMLFVIDLNLSQFEIKNQNLLKDFALISNLSISFIMFFFRQPNLKKILFSCLKKKDNLNRFSVLHEEDSNFFGKDQPLTTVISSCMNLEFMCCILYGLNNIFEDMKNRKEDKLDLIRKTTLNLKNESDLKGINISDDIENQVQKKYYSLISKNLNELEPKDFSKQKQHKIKYQQLFDNQIDVSTFKIEMNKKKHQNIITINSFLNDSLDDYSIKSISMTIKSLNTYDAEIIEYCPKVFKYLRKIDDIDEKICESLNPIENFDNINKMKESQGKSGSFFFFSYDNQFIIKTINNEELNTLLNPFMENYYNHIIENEQTLLAKLYGAYSIIIGGVSKINIVLMQNINPLGFDNLYFKHYFDLKGSLQGRRTANMRKVERGHALKDLDFLNIQKMNDELIDFNSGIISEVLDKLYSDLNMLKISNIMDYSLLFYIYEIPPQNKEQDYNKVFEMFADERYKYKIFKSNKLKYIYILGIIDYLQSYNARKFLENKYKYIFHGKNIKNISAVEPEFYAKRMYNFAKENIFVES